jgi:hypothetical protein
MDIVENIDTSMPPKGIFETLKTIFPNINSHYVFPDGRKNYSEKACLNQIRLLSAVADLYGFCEKVWGFDIHGSMPVMQIDMGIKDPQNPDSAHIINKMYSSTFTIDKKQSEHVWGEGWNPNVLNPDIQTHNEGNGNFEVILE